MCSLHHFAHVDDSGPYQHNPGLFLHCKAHSTQPTDSLSESPLWLVLAPARADYVDLSNPLMSGNYWFMSSLHSRGAYQLDTMPGCFQTLWRVLCVVTPVLRGGVAHLGQQEIGDLLFSLSRERARRLSKFSEVVGTHRL
jgi:hypothetical protein